MRGPVERVAKRRWDVERDNEELRQRCAYAPNARVPYSGAPLSSFFFFPRCMASAFPLPAPARVGEEGQTFRRLERSFDLVIMLGLFQAAQG
jgi:hypothetical protein